MTVYVWLIVINRLVCVKKVTLPKSAQVFPHDLTVCFCCLLHVHSWSGLVEKHVHLHVLDVGGNGVHRQLRHVLVSRYFRRTSQSVAINMRRGGPKVRTTVYTVQNIHPGKHYSSIFLFSFKRFASPF